MSRKIIFLLSSVFYISLVFPKYAHAQALAKCGNPALDFRCLDDIYTSILNNVLGGASIVFLIMIFSGGLKYLTSSGDPKDIENAKGRMTFSALGLGAMILSWFILKFLDQILFGGSGVLTIFNVPHP